MTSANYDQITLGMSKAQVEIILGTPTRAETKDMLIFKKTTYRYEEGKKFAMITFKNDEVDSKDTQSGARAVGRRQLHCDEKCIRHRSVGWLCSRPWPSPLAPAIREGA